MMVWINWLFALIGLPSPSKLVLILGASSLALTGAYFKGRWDSAQNCREAAIRAELAAAKRDLAAAREAGTTADTIIAALENEKARMEKEVSDYAAALKATPNAACSLSASDARRLRRLGDKAKSR